MINYEINEEINRKLKILYGEYCSRFIKAWQDAFATELSHNIPTKLASFGIIDTNSYDADDGILFICKETRNEQQDFLSWLTTMATHNENIQKENMTSHPQIWYNIGRWAKFIKNPQINKQSLLSEKQKALEGLKSISFTNVNKAYGFSRSGNAFWNLAQNEIVKLVLNEEINNIIKPKLIVVCGEGLKDIIDINTSSKIVEMPHPSSRKGNGKLLETLEKRLKECNYYE